MVQRRRGEQVRVVWVERVLTVEFGPSRSKRFAKAVAAAHSSAGDWLELEPGRYRVMFRLGRDLAAYAGLAPLLERVRHWRATDVYEGDEPVSAYHAREMAWCASSQLKWYGDCQMRFFFGVLPRCSLCPLFDAARAIHDALGENPLVLEIRLPNLNARQQGEHAPTLADGSDPDWRVPDYPPEEWEEPAGHEPPG
jgi:hypothetical protein